MILLFVCGIIFYILPEKIKVPLGMTISGAAAGFITVLFAHFVFKLSEFGIGPYIASLASVIPPMITDYRKYRELVLQREALEPDSSPFVTSLADSMASGALAQLVGTVIGLILGGWWFL